MEERIALLEAQLHRLSTSQRRLRWMLGATLLMLAALFGVGFVSEGQTADLVKTRALLVVDEAGTPRVIIGAPVDDKKYMNFERNKPMFGIAICDAKSNEQIGIGVADDGSAGLGLDCKPGVGNPANRERINFGVAPDGSAMIRMLDNDTRLKTMWSTTATGKSGLMFVKWIAKDGKTNPDGAMVYGLESKYIPTEELFGGSAGDVETR